ncbi:MAG TPA: virulence-associated E family protein [Polyangiaceae bacterium]|nr:virulence-associated E family protein [Polyangiaceae bacterium]
MKLSPASVAVGFPWAKLLKQKKDIKGRVIGFSGTIGNAMTVLAEAEPWQNVIGYDEFANEIVLHREPPTRKQDRVPGLEYPRYWSSEDTTRTVTWLTDLFRVEIDPSKVRAAVFAISKRHAYHPVRAWLHSLPVWDGTPRIDRLFVDYMGAEDTDYVRSIGGKFMIGLVARAETPGCKLDTMPIAEGLQGKLKSSALRALMPVAAWFSDTPIDFGSKDAYQCLNGKWLIEIAELDGFDKWDARRIKSFVSSAADYYRPSYGEKAVNFPRQCVFTGTTNDEQYLHDRSGGRRFWPFSVRGKVDLAGIERDREQLFAEALARFRAGDRWWLTETEEEAARIEQGARTAEDPWEGRVVAWLAKPQRREFGHLVGALDVSGGISASEVAEHALGIEPDRQTHSHTIRVGCALKSAGWVSRGKARPRRYFPPA